MAHAHHKHPDPSYSVIQPKPLAQAVAGCFGQHISPIVIASDVPHASKTEASKPHKKSKIRKEDTMEHQGWDNLKNLSNEIRRNIAVVAEQVNESVELVMKIGCDQPKEFGVLVKKTNEDFGRFIADFNIINQEHRDLSGDILTPDDSVKAIQIAEKYQQFQAFFDGVMNHTLVAFTEYALQARDRFINADPASEAEDAAAATSSASTDA